RSRNLRIFLLHQNPVEVNLPNIAPPWLPSSQGASTVRKTHIPNHSAAALASQRTFRDLLAYSEPQLALLDPLEMNLLVAKEIASLSHLDIASYRRTADKWAAEINRGVREAEREFHQTPQDWKNDIHFFRLGYLCYYVDEVLGIRYREDQKFL